MKRIVMIFGERNTSTRAVTQMIEANSDSLTPVEGLWGLAPVFMRRLHKARGFFLPAYTKERVQDLAYTWCRPLESWKHCLTDFEDMRAFQGSHIVFCVRHPASWVLGLFRRPYHVIEEYDDSLGAFLDLRWRTLGRERMRRAKTSATALYNAKLAGYAQFQARLTAAGGTYTTVRHEDFAVDQKAVFDRIAPYLAGPRAAFTPLSASTKDKTKDDAYYRDYYGNQRWREEIDLASMARINTEIDWDLAGRFGYQPL